MNKEQIIPLYVVYNTSSIDNEGNAKYVGQGNNLEELRSVYFGVSYVITKNVII